MEAVATRSIKEVWDALTSEQRDRLLDRYRYADVDHGWWYGVYANFKEKCEGLGIEVHKIYFSGFASQGDGACFEGRVSDWVKFLNGAGKAKEAALLKQLGEESPDGLDVRLSWRHSGHYYHENCTEFGTENLDVDNPFDEDDDPLRAIAWTAIYGEHGPLPPIEDDMIEYVRSLMRDLYVQLEEEYDYLTSDEAVTEAVIANNPDEILREFAGDPEDDEEVY